MQNHHWLCSASLIIGAELIYLNNNDCIAAAACNFSLWLPHPPSCRCCFLLRLSVTIASLSALHSRLCWCPCLLLRLSLWALPRLLHLALLLLLCWSGCFSRSGQAAAKQYQSVPQDVCYYVVCWKAGKWASRKIRDQIVLTSVRHQQPSNLKMHGRPSVGMSTGTDCTGRSSLNPLAVDLKAQSHTLRKALICS